MYKYSQNHFSCKRNSFVKDNLQSIFQMKDMRQKNWNRVILGHFYALLLYRLLDSSMLYLPRQMRVCYHGAHLLAHHWICILLSTPSLGWSRTRRPQQPNSCRTRSFWAVSAIRWHHWQDCQAQQQDSPWVETSLQSRQISADRKMIHHLLGNCLSEQEQKRHLQNTLCTETKTLDSSQNFLNKGHEKLAKY